MGRPHLGFLRGGSVPPPPSPTLGAVIFPLLLSPVRFIPKCELFGLLFCFLPVVLGRGGHFCGEGKCMCVWFLEYVSFPLPLRLEIGCLLACGVALWQMPVFSGRAGVEGQWGLQGLGFGVD